MDKGSYQFSFGVITDTHIRAPEGDMSSPFPVNEKANGRARYATRLLAAQKPSFTIHLGDMVHPLPTMPAYPAAAKEALEIFAPLMPELYFMPGNHDIGDKPMPGSPANAASASTTEIYESLFGAGRFEFTHQGVLFIVLNSSIINTQTPEEQQQRDWLESLLAGKPANRIYLFSHYPLFIHDPAEQEHYDNIAQPGREWLLELIDQYQIDLVLSGHVHHYFYNRLNKTSLYTLPPVSFTRQDYADLFKVSPAAEFGRDDTGKFSVAMVDVYESGHELRILPTYGKSLTKNNDTENSLSSNIPANVPASGPLEKPLTVHMRHPWYESIELPYNGPMEEFSRKRARNDYLFMRLQQLGIHHIRVPVADMLASEPRQRMRDYIALGFYFHAFFQSHLADKAILVLKEHPELFSSIECVTTHSPLELAVLQRQDTPRSIPLYLGHAQSGAMHTGGNKPFAHSVSSGFLWRDRSVVLNAIDAMPEPGRPDGVVFQIPLEADLVATLTKMQEAFTDRNIQCIANIKLASSNPAEAGFDDQDNANRINTALKTAARFDSVDLQLDTIIDVDRGYAPRNGVIDRRGNIRDAFASWLQ